MSGDGGLSITVVNWIQLLDFTKDSAQLSSGLGQSVRRRRWRCLLDLSRDDTLRFELLESSGKHSRSDSFEHAFHLVEPVFARREESDDVERPLTSENVPKAVPRALPVGVLRPLHLYPFLCTGRFYLSKIVPFAVLAIVHGTDLYLESESQLSFVKRMNRTVPSDGARDERFGEPRTKVWVVASNENQCEHPKDNLRLIGDDGKNVYYRCELCEVTLISESELFVQTSLVR